jgi:hypothetical protein
LSIDTNLDENADRVLELYGMPFVINRQLEKECSASYRVGLASLQNSLPDKDIA